MDHSIRARRTGVCHGVQMLDATKLGSQTLIYEQQ